jgi:hypothetical protein
MSEARRDGLDFSVDRKDWSRFRFDESGPPAEPSAGQVLFQVDRFAFTSNNISYAMAGDMLRYWDFFPAEEGWGRIPTMGFADVIASAHPEVAEGQRVFGFFPMSRYVVIEPSRVSSEGIVDGVAHRVGIAPAYNTYAPIESDPAYSALHEDETMLLRGLFLTSFLVDDFLAEHDRYGARSVVIGSASSKTAIALAFLLAEARSARVVGLTSARNAAFVKGLGHYDEVLLYDEVDELPADIPSVLVDMSGNGDMLNRIHRRLGKQLRYSCIVGATHWGAAPRDENLPGPKPEFFFAPGQIQKRAAEWGPGVLQQRMGAAWVKFRDSTEAWLRVRRGYGKAAVEQVYRETLAAEQGERS